MSQVEELARLIARFAPSDGVHQTAIPRLKVVRLSQPSEPMHGLHEPALCIIAQGAKQVILGDRIYRYDAAHCLVVSLDLPVIGQVIEATPDEPYLCVKLELDPAAIGALMLEAPPLAETEPSSGPGLTISPMTPALRDAVIRLTGLLETPADIAVLAPLVEREILYRLLTGDQAARLRQIAVAESKLQQVNRAIGWIKRNYRKPFSVEVVAAEARMSPSALHQHFKAVTAMSPLQYQKQLRLQEARRLILAKAHDAASAGFQVGYESPSQFSREYSRLFGAPPLRDVARLRGASAADAA
ncbi:AraC family transcriptional regulator [Bosea sp. (in: a-proteobacteria)]|jgi:AraC-like DNA-binding protein|uniref:AraC family transcriptional regulator n=1 Tax=Bosea sp. (in: a-proteobacteria) TaxID=1871050 RepID=UPI001E1688F5|nr:AraC family transcriptional regulator [Bosea sp. (in: a-proteobacteria)]MBA4224634.1 AraC family transcriptional regulator CmrA [Methylobacterium sp.]MBR3190142.1 AraC family transcriptional regulator [Bosea sp. (in: a-proteobacteria)]